MIQLIKTISTENPINEMWNYLFLFCDESFYIGKIQQSISSLDFEKNRLNIEKQAKQIKLSLKQAKEYFDAANEVSIITKPLLVYYGYVALSKALILIKNDGEYSYDYMRMKEKHNHHGLNLKKDFSTCNSKYLSDFLGTIESTVNFNKDTPWGNFPIFYNSISSDSILITGKYEIENSSIYATEYQLCDSVDKRQILNKMETFNLLELFQYLPDLYSYFDLKKIETKLFPVNISKSTFAKTGIKVNGSIVNADKLRNFSIVINEIKKDDIGKIIEYYKKIGFDFLKISDNAISCTLSETIHIDDNKSSMFIPDAVSGISEETYCIFNSEHYITESASYYIILFMLSMLCRYFPDIWVDRIEKLDGFSELISFYMQVAIRKVPNLILNQMTDTKFIFKGTSKK